MGGSGLFLLAAPPETDPLPPDGGQRWCACATDIPPRARPAYALPPSLIDRLARHALLYEGLRLIRGGGLIVLPHRPDIPSGRDGRGCLERVVGGTHVRAGHTLPRRRCFTFTNH